MTTNADRSPATLYGGASLALGVLALLGAVFVGVAGLGLPLLCGSLAGVFGALGLGSGFRGVLHRRYSALGLGAGVVAVLYLGFLVTTLGG
ncbi:hypothetical protein [Streptomyces sp. NPDC005438]|uniref:hypothetical protein n=1 Tax=Streptomyces sp. NPDC005438 TaxID=3156880 RepID=UPI0033B82FEE